MNRNTAQNSIRLWAVIFWLLIWQGASMLFAALWPNGHLLLASPISAAVRLGELACTAAFWRAAPWRWCWRSCLPGIALSGSCLLP